MLKMTLQFGLAAGLFALVLIGTGVAQQSGGAVSAPVSAATPPLPPKPAPVTELFRKLLVATPDELEILLEGRTPESRAVLVRKLEEYRNLAPAQRELSLGTLDLRGYLTVLIPMDAGARAEWIAAIPGTDRAGVEVRLRAWDRLAPSVRQRLLTEGKAALLLSKVQIDRLSAGSTDPAPQTRLLPPLPIPRMPQLPQIEQAVSNWRTLPALRREKVAEHMMELPTSPFEGLGPEERERCMEAFKRYMQLSKSERARFLYNADRWRKMSPQDRRTFRSLTHAAMPPMPPSLGTPPLVTPPLVTPPAPRS